MRSLRSVMVASLLGARCVRGVALARSGGLSRRSGSARPRSLGRRHAAHAPALVRGGMACRLATARSADAFSAAVVLVDCRPGATFGLLLWDAAAFVALLDMSGFALL